MDSIVYESTGIFGMCSCRGRVLLAEPGQVFFDHVQDFVYLPPVNTLPSANQAFQYCELKWASPAPFAIRGLDAPIQSYCLQHNEVLHP